MSVFLVFTLKTCSKFQLPAVSTQLTSRLPVVAITRNTAACDPESRLVIHLKSDVATSRGLLWDCTTPLSLRTLFRIPPDASTTISRKHVAGILGNALH